MVVYLLVHLPKASRNFGQNVTDKTIFNIEGTSLKAVQNFHSKFLSRKCLPLAILPTILELRSD